MLNIKLIRDPRLRKRDVSIYTKAMHVRLIALMHECIRSYLRAILQANTMKADTGMSKASLLPLARKVRMFTEFAGTINPKRPSRLGMTDINGRWQPKKFRSYQAGLRAGVEGKGFKINVGSPNRPVLNFQFNIQVFQYFLHEFGYRGKTGQTWNTLNIGTQAFLQTFEDRAEDFVPDLMIWLLTGTITDER